MAAAFCSSSSSSSISSSLSPHPLPHPPFTPIQECEREGKEEDECCEQNSANPTPSDCSENKESYYFHQSTPHHHSNSKTTVKSSRKRSESCDTGKKSDDRGVLFNKCRPNAREKFSVVPLDTTTVGRHSNASPNGLFKSIFSSIVKRSPRSGASSSERLTPVPATEEQWRSAVTELSHKLIHATKKRDEAILEASRLKFSMAELEKKLNKLEMYCHNLKSGLDNCANKSPTMKHEPIKIGDHDRVIEHFLVSVSESRTSMRHLSRLLTLQLPQIDGGKLYDRIQLLLQPYEIKISSSTNPRILLLYLEALLNRAFFEDFESLGFQKSGSNHILNPIHRCEENFKSFIRLKELSWEEVLSKGTKQFSEEFSKFCDRKMSEVVSMLGWTRAWPELLLQAFFGASKAVWLVHLLANSVHPGLPIFRVDKGVRFDSVYMEDMGGDRAPKLMSPTVRIMVEPGFYIYGNVVKCKVICKYHGNNGFVNVSPNSNHS